MISFILKDGAKLPERGSQFAAGLDIHANHNGCIPAGGRMLVQTGVYLADCPIGMYLRVAPRSKLANKYGIDTLAGVVDADYRGQVGVILHNNGSGMFEFSKGDAIAQLIPETITISPVREVTEATESERGEKGINCSEERR